jgi:hypothetical protein
MFQKKKRNIQIMASESYTESSELGTNCKCKLNSIFDSCRNKDEISFDILKNYDMIIFGAPTEKFKESEVLIWFTTTSPVQSS